MDENNELMEMKLIIINRLIYYSIVVSKVFKIITYKNISNNLALADMLTCELFSIHMSCAMF